MDTHATHQSFTHRLNSHHVTIHGTATYVPPQTNHRSDADRTLYSNSAALPEVANV